MSHKSKRGKTATMTILIHHCQTCEDIARCASHMRSHACNNLHVDFVSKSTKHFFAYISLQSAFNPHNRKLTFTSKGLQGPPKVTWANAWAQWATSPSPHAVIQRLSPPKINIFMSLSPLVPQKNHCSGAHYRYSF